MSHSGRIYGSRHRNMHIQQGAAFIVMMVIMVIGVIAILAGTLSSTSIRLAKDEKTQASLAQAKEALIGYAVSVDLTGSKRPGDLPCPDTNNDGYQEPSCGNASGTTGQSSRLGRLPWKTLGLPDLRDSSGERLWYAVSNKFKENTKTTCTNSNLTDCLNSDTEGSINVRNSDGSILHAGNASTAAVAIIIAPGDILQRQDSSTQQDRSSSGINTASNYLDIATVSGNTEDNADFTDGSASNGFIHGRILDSNGQVILNDQLLVITEYHIIPPLEKRVASEVKNCLNEYAAMPQNRGPSPNQGYYPFATARTSGTPVTYNDSDRLVFGHIPDMPFAETCSSTGGNNCSSTQSGGMENTWGATCTLTNSNWWVNWKEMVFFGYPNSLRPHNLNHNHACSNMTTCLVVNPPSTTTDKKFVVIIAGEKLPSQVRTSNADKSNLSNYLEGDNNDSATPFEQSPPSTTFNDIVVFQ